jgi:hypothetical protein
MGRIWIGLPWWRRHRIFHILALASPTMFVVLVYPSLSPTLKWSSQVGFVSALATTIVILFVRFVRLVRKLRAEHRDAQ